MRTLYTFHRTLVQSIHSEFPTFLGKCGGKSIYKITLVVESNRNEIKNNYKNISHHIGVLIKVQGNMQHLVD